jgi:hypothetical protein
MMTIDEAFRAGMKLVREAGLPIKGTDAAVIVALRIFESDCRGKDTNDPRVAEQAPIHAKRLIIRMLAR